MREGYEYEKVSPDDLYLKEQEINLNTGDPDVIYAFGGTKIGTSTSNYVRASEEWKVGVYRVEEGMIYMAFVYYIESSSSMRLLHHKDELLEKSVGDLEEKGLFLSPVENGYYETSVKEGLMEILTILEFEYHGDLDIEDAEPSILTELLGF